MRELLKALWKTADKLNDGALTIWLNPGKRSLHMPAENIRTLDASDMADLHDIAGNRNVYFGLGLREKGLPENRQGGKAQIVAMPGSSLDIDFRNPRAHKALNLPKDLDEAAILLEGLPPPSAIVLTANGVHVYWFFKVPLILDTPTKRTQAQKAYSAWQKPIIALAAKHGWQLDDTASIQRVWRLPGFTNQKTDKLVELAYCDPDVRYTPEEIGIKMPEPRSAKEEKEETAAPAPSSELVKQLTDSLTRVSPNNKFKIAIKAVLKGKSMANPGERDQTLQGVCSTIAWFPEGREADPAELAEILRPSLQVWADEPGDDKKTIEQEMAKAIDKIKRNQQDYWAKQAELRPKLAGIARALGVDLDDDEATIDISKSEKARVKDVPNEFFIRRSIIQYRDSYYIYDFRIEQYTGMKKPSELIPVLRDAWADGPDTLDIEYENAKGKTCIKAAPQIAQEYCTNTDKVIGFMTEGESWFEIKKGRSTFHEAIAQPQVTEAVYDEQIDLWLKLMVGSGRCKPTKRFPEGRPVIDLLFDWIAAVPQLGSQNSALYLDGFGGAGKGLLSNGLSRIWHNGGPTEFELVTGSFNNDIARCPLLRIDEGLPDKRGDITKKLRSMLGTQSFTLNEKNLPTRVVNGAIRLIICANNDRVLNTGDADYSQRDIEAISKRILYIPTQKPASDWLEEHNENGALTTEWVDGHGIAKHCLWLRDNRKIVRGGRFMVEGGETGMHRQMIMGGDTNGLIYEWMVRFASDPDPVNKRYRSAQSMPLAQTGDGELLVNAEAVISCWDCYMKHAKLPKSDRIGPALGKLSYRTARLGPRGARQRFHAIKADMILEWCERHQIGNEDKIAANLKRKMKIEPEQKESLD